MAPDFENPSRHRRESLIAISLRHSCSKKNMTTELINRTYLTWIHNYLNPPLEEGKPLINKWKIANAIIFKIIFNRSKSDKMFI
jgi:hypothetical protein